MFSKISLFKLPLLKLTAIIFVFAWFFIGGVTHFYLPKYYLSIVPPIIAYKLAAVYVSGFFELIGAFALLFSASRRLAGLGLITLTVLVTPANIYMLQNAEQFSSVPEWALVARLPVQLILIWLIWWCTRIGDR